MRRPYRITPATALPTEFWTSRNEIQHEYRNIPDPDEPQELHMFEERHIVRRNFERPLMDRRWS